MDTFRARERVAKVHKSLLGADNEHSDTVRRVAEGEADVNRDLRGRFDALDMQTLYGESLADKNPRIEDGMRVATKNPHAVDPPEADPERTNLEYVEYLFSEGLL